MSERLVIFDCDGTLADSHGFFVSCLLKAFDEAGVAVPANMMTDMILAVSLKELMHFLSDKIPADKLEYIYEGVLRNLNTGRQSGENHEPLFEGVVPMLSMLQARGYKLAIATNKRQVGLDAVLKLNGVEQFFNVAVTSDTCPTKPAPDMINRCMAQSGATQETTLMIGDSMADVLAAQNAGVRAIAVTWALKTVPDFTAGGAAKVVAKVADLPKAIAELVG